MEAVITTKSHIEIKNGYHFYINKNVKPCELYVWTTKPLSESFYISYEITKNIYGVVQPLLQIIDYEEYNIYYDNFKLYKSKKTLHINEEFYNSIFYKYDNSHIASLLIYSSLQCNINNVYLLSYIRGQEN